MSAPHDSLLNIKNKIELFLSSFSPLWAIMIISYLIKSHDISDVIIAIIISIIIAMTISDTVKNFRQLRTSSNSEEMTMKEVKEITQDYIPYVVSYLFPVLSDLTNPTMLFSVIAVLIIIGVLYVRTDMLLTNPALLLVGFRLYEVEAEGHIDKLKIISKSVLGRNDKPMLRMITNKIYIERKNTA